MNKQELSSKIGLPIEYLDRLAKNADKLYNTYYIPKKNGKYREIESPNTELKGIQSWILDNILDEYNLPSCVYGFRKKHDIKKNASVHIGNKYILCIDIKDFFPSIPKEAVENVFLLSCNAECSILLAKISCFRSRLPQGAVCSPALSNIVFSKADSVIMETCSTKRISYSRYADDLSFSSNNKTRLQDLMPEIKKIINENHFIINETKTRFLSGSGPMTITGLTINGKKPSIGNDRKKLLRAQIFDYIVNENKEFEKRILGMLSFLRYIEPEKYISVKKYIDKLVSMKERKT